ncbi:induced myeloid leukemia cell differentiation protein Mcl-1 homolog, partial [Lagopus leucura]|uniref:induced myeloid leukemia cell differentiation protein Mcl-1 homolog n=1 Tax=Lagopus leucura TaxID=30410 RepID=UPI001C67E5EE
MFAVKRNAVIGFNLYCGGGGPGLVPASPAGDQTPPPPAAAPAATAAEVPRPLIGSAGRWAAGGRAEAPRAPIGSEATPRVPLGSAAVRRLPSDSAPRPVALWSPEEELDGCEPESERGPGGDSLPSTPPELPDELRRDSLELILRYLREAAGEAEPGVKKLFPGLLGGPGRPGRTGGAVMEKALETLRRVGDGVMQKHELAFQGAWKRETG